MIGAEVWAGLRFPMEPPSHPGFRAKRLASEWNPEGRRVTEFLLGL